MTKRALFLGRFQPLHIGHISFLKHIEKEVDEIVIAIGSAQYGFSKDNPLTAGERIEILSKTLKNTLSKPFYLIPIEDIHCYPKYVSHVKTYTPKFNIVYTGNPIVKHLFQKVGYEVKKPEIEHKTSATSIRQALAKDEKWEHLIHPITKIELKNIRFKERIKQIFQEGTK